MVLISLKIAAMVMLGIAVFIIMKTVFEDEAQYQALESLDDIDKKVSKSNEGFVLKYSKPFFKRYFTPVVSSLKNKRKIREKYKRPLANAGLSDILTPDDFFAFKLFLIIGFPIVFLIIRSFIEADWPFSAMPLLAAFGFIYPDIWIKGMIKQRNKQIINAFPFIVDLLALSIEAGLDFVAAMGRVIDKAPPGPINDEFEKLIKEIRIGASRAEALRNLSWRVDINVMASFCATLIAADSVGASVGPILKKLSEEIRSKRSAEVEKEGAQATTKMLVPMIFLVVPAVFLVIAAPLVLEAMAGG